MKLNRQQMAFGMSAGALFVAYALILIAALVGWVMNLITLISVLIHNGPIDALFIGRLIGVPVAILGAILGYV